MAYSSLLSGLTCIPYALALLVVGAALVWLLKELGKTNSQAARMANDVEIARIQYLLQETEDWPDVQMLRAPYLARLALLTGSGRTAIPAAAPTAPVPPAPMPVLPAAAVPVGVEPERIAEQQPAPPAAPAAPPVAFDQWLLSERNIKIALYTGGVLLIMAGLIFIGVNWAHLPGLAKLAITLAFTALMYAGGVILYARPSLRIGGFALLVIASGFAPLNFIVLQTYLLSDLQVTAATTQMAASLVCLAAYALTAFRTRHALFTYFSLIALASGIRGAYLVLGIDFNAGLVVYAIAALGLGLAAFAVRERPFAGFVSRPLLIAANVVAPLVFIMAVLAWVGSQTYVSYNNGPVSLLFLAMLFVVAHYVAADRLYRAIAARWAAALLFAFTIILLLIELDLSSIATGILLKALALVYLVVGFVLMGGRGKQVRPGLPLLATGYGLAAFVSLQALDQIVTARDQFALALLADVALLLVSALLFRNLGWVFGAVWLFIAPVSLYATVYLNRSYEWGAVLGGLMLIYVAGGYFAWPRSVRVGIAFLSAAAFLSAVVPLLMVPNWTLTSIALLVVAALYVLVALWRRWQWLLLASLAAVNLAVPTLALIDVAPGLLWTRIVVYSLAALGIVLTVIGITLGTRSGSSWRMPVYAVAFFDLLGAYAAGLLLDVYTAGAIPDRLFVVCLSAVIALIAWSLTLFESDILSGLKMPRLPSYLAPAFLFVGFFYLLQLLLPFFPYKMAVLAGFCVLLVAASYLVRRAPRHDLFDEPLRDVGLGLVLVPLVGILVQYTPLPTAATFAVGSLLLLGDATVRRDRYFFYLGGGLGLVVIWSLLHSVNVTEPQAYAVPAGLGLLVLGWVERTHGKRAYYHVATLLGLLILMGSAFVQSIDQTIYAVLLFAESLIAFTWGVRVRSRRYVEMAVLALVLNGLAQFGPGFAQLDRWIQIGTIGAILLGGGLAALFRRDRILAARKSLTQNWRGLEP